MEPKAKYILQTLCNLYNNAGLGGPGLIDRVRVALVKRERGEDIDVANEIMSTHVISFGDNREELAKFRAKIAELLREEVI